jgi:hypothetical protein
MIHRLRLVSLAQIRKISPHEVECLQTLLRIASIDTHPAGVMKNGYIFYDYLRYDVESTITKVYKRKQ